MERVSNHREGRSIRLGSEAEFLVHWKSGDETWESERDVREWGCR